MFAGAADSAGRVALFKFVKENAYCLYMYL
jgi:hypothetical protein